MRMNRHGDLDSCLRMIFSESAARFPDHALARSASPAAKLQMSGALVLGLRPFDGKADCGADGQPVRTFAGDVVAVNDVHGEDLIRTIAYAGLHTRLHR